MLIIGVTIDIWLGLFRSHCYIANSPKTSFQRHLKLNQMIWPVSVGGAAIMVKMAVNSVRCYLGG